MYASRKLWDSATVVQVRIRLAQIEAGLKERRHHFHYSLKVGLGVSRVTAISFRHAIPRAQTLVVRRLCPLQVSLLSLPAFLSPSSASREWWVDSRGQWIPISFLYVLETTAGQTWRIGFYRAIGTVSGSILGCIVSPRRPPFQTGSADVDLSFLLVGDRSGSSVEGTRTVSSY